MKNSLARFFGLISKSFLLSKEVALVFSCMFFLGLCCVAIIIPDYAANFFVVIIAGMMFVFLFMAKRNILREVFYIAGSFAFFLFLFSRYFFEKSSLGQIFGFYQEKVEYALNFGTLSIFLYVLFFIMIFHGLPIIFILVQRLIKKLTAGRLEESLLNALNMTGLLFIFLFLILMQIDRVTDWLMESVFHISNLMIPVLGFSLIYLHANLLIRKVFKKEGEMGERFKPTVY